MVKAPGIAVPKSEAEATRRQLVESNALRDDLKVLSRAEDVVFPVTEGAQAFEFVARDRRARNFTDLLPTELRAQAPRAHDVLGDIIVIKIPEGLTAHAGAIGAALLEFHQARAVFHDNGVVGVFRTRHLERIAGTGGSRTQVSENGVRLVIDPAGAYFSPRLATERERMTGMAASGQTWIDLFGGVGPLAVQLARAGATVHCNDLNPDACAMARENATLNQVDVTVHNLDAKDAPARLSPADHVVMNLPHGAKDFLASGATLCLPGGVLHHHEILLKDRLPQRQTELIAEFAALGRVAAIRTVRHVRDYSSLDAHYTFDVVLS
jgi:tRNA (guanine37-N1)-methyltransferase